MRLRQWLFALIRRRATEITSALWCAFALFVAVSLITYNPADPSGNVSTDHMPTNWGGVLGAYLSDILLQFFGVAGVLFAIVPLAWAVKMIRHIPLGMPSLRFALLLFSLPALATFMNFFPAPLSWPIIKGLGGVVGAVLHDRATSLLGTVPSFVLVMVVAGLLIYGAFAVKNREWKAIAERFSFLWHYVQYTFSLLRRSWSSKSAERTPAPERKPRNTAKRAKPAVDAPSRVEASGKTKTKKERQTALSLPTGNGGYQLPPVAILSAPDGKVKRPSSSALEQNARLLESVLSDFGVNGEITKVRPGPVVTLYELEPSPGTKSSRVIGLADDIARSMSAISARIAVIPGRNAIGIELPNASREMVAFREIIEDDTFAKSEAKLAIGLGKDIGGEPVIADLARMPHLLVAGTTGSGKSVAVNTMIASLLYRLTPDECRFIMIDPKMLELSVYDGIPHLLAPVVTEPGKAVVALKWTVKEMENRYRLMSNLGVRNIDGYNKRILEAKARGTELTRTVQTGFDVNTGKPVIEEVPLEMNPLPYIVVIVDEMADLMLVAGKDIEASIQRLAQMARAAGIHLIMATQRPSVDVITGVIKANFPTRISFQVTSRIDSRTILGEQGAEMLLGQGDMLYMAGGGRITRVHGPFVSDGEVETLVNFLKAQGEPQYIETITEEEEEFSGDMDEGDGEDQLYRKAVQIVMRDKKISTSYIQRNLRIGYNRAADLMDRMEREGIVSPPNHAGKRELLQESY